MILNRETILAPRKPVIESLEIPEWGGTVYVRVPTPRQLEEFESKSAKLKAAGNLYTGLRARIAILACCDENGAPIFTAADEAALMTGDGNLGPLSKINDWLAPRVGWAADEIEERAKNSQATDGDDSSSV